MTFTTFSNDKPAVCLIAGEFWSAKVTNRLYFDLQETLYALCDLGHSYLSHLQYLACLPFGTCPKPDSFSPKPPHPALPNLPLILQLAALRFLTNATHTLSRTYPTKYKILQIR